MFKKFAIAAVMATAATASFADVDMSSDNATLADIIMKADAYVDANNGNCSGHGGTGSDSLAAAIEFRAINDNTWYPGAPSICDDRHAAYDELRYRAQQTLLSILGSDDASQFEKITAYGDYFVLASNDYQVDDLVTYMEDH